MKFFNKWFAFFLFTVCLIQTAAAGGSETIQKEFTLSRTDSSFKVAVNNVWGPISVKGISGNIVKARIHKTIEARSGQQRQLAIEEVVLDISMEDNLLEFYVDGPFREHHPKNRDRHWHSRKYHVIYNFELEVPRDVSVDIQTVNDGDIIIEGIHGNYHVENINGGICMKGLRGSGKAYALNEDLICTFDRNPERNSRFGSLNGDVRLYFQDPLSAQFAMKTFNGDAFTDFILTHVASDPEIIEKKNGKTVYKFIHRYCAQAGKGGPRIELDGFNGDLLILKHRKGV